MASIESPRQLKPGKSYKNQQKTCHLRARNIQKYVQRDRSTRRRPESWQNLDLSV